jgi:hypothetical protein
MAVLHPPSRSSVEHIDPKSYHTGTRMNFHRHVDGGVRSRKPKRICFTDLAVI